MDLVDHLDVNKNTTTTTTVTQHRERMLSYSYKYTHGGGGGGGYDGTLPGKFCIFRFKFIAFKAMLMCFISRSLSLKIRIY